MVHCAQWRKNHNIYMHRFMSYLLFSHYFHPYIFSYSISTLTAFLHNSCPTVHTVQCSLAVLRYFICCLACKLYVCCWDDSGLRLPSLCPLCLSGFVFSSGFSLWLCLCPFSACSSFQFNAQIHKLAKARDCVAERGTRGGHRQRLQLNARCQKG